MFHRDLELVEPWSFSADPALISLFEVTLSTTPRFVRFPMSPYFAAA